jgi:hypothetical protein
LQVLRVYIGHIVDLKENSDVDHQARRTRRSGHGIVSAFFPVSSPVADRQRHCCGCRMPPDSDEGCSFRAGRHFNSF